jgi:hypothetical protein
MSLHKSSALPAYRYIDVGSTKISKLLADDKFCKVHESKSGEILQGTYIAVYVSKLRICIRVHKSHKSYSELNKLIKSKKWETVYEAAPKALSVLAWQRVLELARTDAYATGWNAHIDELNRCNQKL